LIEKKVLTEAKKKQIADGITREIDEAVEFAEKSPYPDASEITNFVWAD
jgi:TPP-dependent pyruvate/acetoin dehydrogenase alpha subunit